MFNVNLTSKSFLLGPSDFLISTKAGKKSFSMCLGGVSILASMGKRSASYPARINRPSGGTKLSSPGLSRHRASRTQGWNTGSSIFWLIALWPPPGVVRHSKRSGTPEILAVKAIVPDTSADKIRPDGAIVTDNVSIMSTYSSFDVWRTPGRRHGMAGPEAAAAAPGS